MLPLIISEVDMSNLGTPAHKLHRAESPVTSVEAAYSVDTTRLEGMVFDAVCKHKLGCIQDQVLAQFPGYPYSSITARFRALLDKGLIVDTGEKRAGRSGRGQRVLRVATVANDAGLVEAV